MPYEYHDRNDISGGEPRGFDRQVQRFLFSHFSEQTAKTIYCLGIRIVAFFRKVGLFLTLPFKFIQFWIEEYRKIRNN